MPENDGPRDDRRSVGAAQNRHDRTPTSELDDDLRLITTVVREAGAIGLPYSRKGARSWLKSGNSPVTEADIAIDDFLRTDLTYARPNYGWVSEESRPEPFKNTAGVFHSFVVDPIDGTRAFMDGSDEWTICVAILQNGKPVAGAVYAPAREEMFHAAVGAGAWCNDKPLAVSRQSSLSGARLAASKKAVRALGQGSSGVSARYVPSLAYRLAGVASGVYDGTISTGRAHIWDIAAAAVIVTEAGGLVTDTDADAPVYTEQDCRVPPLVVAGPRLHSLLCDALRNANPDGPETRTK